MHADINKDGLVEIIAKKTNQKRQVIEEMVDAFVDAIMDALHEDKKVTIAGFGTFEVSHRHAREGVNPQTKERIVIPSLSTPKFRAGKRLKEAVKVLKGSTSTQKESSPAATSAETRKTEAPAQKPNQEAEIQNPQDRQVMTSETGEMKKSDENPSSPA